MVRYEVRPDRAAENEELVRAVYAELEDTQPEGFSYATFVQDDGVSFIHVATASTEDGRSPLDDVVAFASFLEELGDRCVASPTSTTLRRIGSYRVFGE
jgi:hypothetical protein